MTALGGLTVPAEQTRTALEIAGLDVDGVWRVVCAALDEDLRYGPDATTEATVPPEGVAIARVVPRSTGVFAGRPVALAVLDAVLGTDYQVLASVPDGATVRPERPALVIRGRTRGLLTAERTVLNVICHLSGIATTTARWVATVSGTSTVLRDSRKTLPGLRELEKYAVRCGGGVNHRFGLGDAILVKDNHVQAAGSVTAAIDAVRAHAPDLPCEVEVDNLDQLDQALRAQAVEILLDNFTPEQCADAVHRVHAAGVAIKLEASGGLTVDVARAYAETGVDYLAVGALTHSAPALDLGMELETIEEQGRARR